MEAGLPVEMRQVAGTPGYKIVEAYYTMVFRQQTVTHMGRNEAGSTRNDDSQISS
jgi:hypothetical protein